jgi:hypothetical protein
MTEPVDNTPSSESSSILAPEPKCKLSEAQLANLAKGREARDNNRKKRAEDKETYVKELQEKKTAKILQEKQKLKQIVGVDSDNEDTQQPVAEEKIIVKKPPKAVKKKIIVLPPSDDEEDEVEEQIIYRKPSKAKFAPPEKPTEPVRKIIFF